MSCSIEGEKCGFKCTGADFSNVWKLLHDIKGPILGKMNCEECREHAKELFIFLHDVVNVGLGKPAFDEKNFKRIYKQIECISSHLKSHELE